jgi:hypothetical protein
MIIKMYAVYDKNVGAYMSPFTSLNDNSAIRNFSQAALNPEAFGKYPQDYDLFKIGEYDDSNAKFTNADPNPIHLISAVNAVQVEMENMRYAKSLQMDIEEYANNSTQNTRPGEKNRQETNGVLKIETTDVPRETSDEISDSNNS